MAMRFGSIDCGRGASRSRCNALLGVACIFLRGPFVQGGIGSPGATPVQGAVLEGVVTTRFQDDAPAVPKL